LYKEKRDNLISVPIIEKEIEDSIEKKGNEGWEGISWSTVTRGVLYLRAAVVIGGGRRGHLQGS